jgi:hypothetical protein
MYVEGQEEKIVQSDNDIIQWVEEGNGFIFCFCFNLANFFFLINRKKAYKSYWDEFKQ